MKHAFRREKKVPRAWRAHNSLRSLYSWSSLLYCAAGLFILAFLRAHRARALYPLQFLEGLVRRAVDIVPLSEKAFSKFL